jgi:hypothetical protein
MRGDTASVDRQLVIPDRDSLRDGHGVGRYVDGHHISAFKDNNSFSYVDIDTRDREETVPRNKDRFDGRTTVANISGCIENGSFAVKVSTRHG